MGKIEIVNRVPKDLKDQAANVDDIVREFAEACEPVEASLLVMVDAKNGARYCEEAFVGAIAGAGREGKRIKAEG